MSASADASARAGVRLLRQRTFERLFPKWCGVVLASSSADLFAAGEEDVIGWPRQAQPALEVITTWDGGARSESGSRGAASACAVRVARGEQAR